MYVLKTILGNHKKIFYIIFFFYLIISSLFLSFNLGFSIKEAPPELFKSFTVNIFFDGEKLKVDPDYPNPFWPSILSPQKYPEGPYEIRILSNNGELLFSTKIQPPEGKSVLYLPYFLNAKSLLILNPDQTEEKYDITSLQICNENNICEPGEENLCPLDCKTAKNPNYPFSQPIKELAPITTQFKVVTKTTEKEIPLPSKIFSNIFLITLATIGAILVFVLIIYFIKRKK